MQKDDVWAIIHSERKALADDLGSLSAAQWATPSLCSGWTVRDALAHMTATARMTPPSFLGKMLMSGFSFDKVQSAGIAGNKGASPAETLARFRAEVSSSTHPPGPNDSWLGETLVHSQDIRRPLGIAHTYSGADFFEWNDFSVKDAENAGRVTRNLHVSFIASSRAQVDEAWQAAVSAGYTDDGAPGERTAYRADYCGGFLRDPDGNSVEAVHHGDARRGGHIDHLWIRVGDLEPAEDFYSVIARHTGLREGRQWPGGRQFRGAWATFSLVQDGGPVTEHLHMAFPAPDRVTVEDFHRAATARGYRSNGPPGERARYHPGYYAAYVLDPEGTNVESVVHE